MKGKMNQCVFMAILRLKMSSFHKWKNTSFSIWPQFPDSQKDVLCILRVMYGYYWDTVYHSMIKMAGVFCVY